MTFVDKTLEQMLQEIEFEEWVIDDTINPAKNPDYFEKSELERRPLSPTPKYKSIIISQLEIDGRKRNELNLVLEEVITNMHAWGNKADDNLPIKIKVGRGKQGYILRFEDSGDGFDYKERIRRIKVGEGNYFDGKGLGMASLEIYDIEASYEEKGNILNIKVGEREK